MFLYFVLNRKFINSKTFQSINIIKYWSWQARKLEAIMIWKKLKITVKREPFQRDCWKRGKKKILDEPSSNFPLKKDPYITKTADLS